MDEMHPLYSLIIPLLLLCTSDNKEEPTCIRGVYGSPAPFWNQGLDLKELGVTAIFIHSASLSREIMNRAKKEGIKVFAEFPTLNGKGYVETHPEAWPVNEKGERAEPASWFMGVCPTDHGFKRHRSEQMKELLRKYDLDGVWIDYVHWHAQFEDPKPILPETCFCERCLSEFQAATLIQIPDGTTSDKSTKIFQNYDREWRNWRCSVIAGWARDLKAILHQERPGALFGMFHCPWNDEEFSGARRRILGIDYEMLKGTVDVFSPMVYHKRMGRSPEWVKENVDWFCRIMNVRPGGAPMVWPIVQAYDDPARISPEEFGTILSYGLSAGATGVMMFTSQSVAEDPGKTEAMKRFYTGMK